MVGGMNEPRYRKKKGISMDIFSAITFIGGLAFFLYGMNVLSNGLEKLAGSKLEKFLKKMTSSRLKCLLLGTGITMAIQSSSAMTVMLVGLVNSGIMELGQTIGIIMGSNIGTTFTAWILSLTGIESDVVWMKLLKPENFSLVFAFVGVTMMMMAKTRKKKDIGSIMVGFAVLMYGMKLMSVAVSPLAEMPAFANLMVAFENPLLGVLVGALFTAMIQSSSASVGVLQVLSMTGNISYGMGIPIIMGQNIGTCVTAILSSLGANKNGKRVAVVHIAFNLIGTGICLVLLLLANVLLDLPILRQAMNPFEVAIAHSIFNLVTTMMLLPMSKLLERIAYRLVKDEGEKKEQIHIDENLFATPAVAISECMNYTVNMAFIAFSSVMRAVKLVGNYTQQGSDEVMECEDQLDLYEDKLGSYLVRMSSQDLSEEDSHRSSEILRNIGDFERIGDHAVNIMESAQEMQDKGVHFSPEGQREVDVLSGALEEVLQLSVNAFATGDIAMAQQVEPLEQVVDELVFEIRKNHIQRLQAGICTIELGFILSDLLTDMERISDHCSNIATTVIENDKGKVGFAGYTRHAKMTESEHFETDFNNYKVKYSLKK